MRNAVKSAAQAAAIYLLTNKKARALEYALLLGAFEAAKKAFLGDF